MTTASENLAALAERLRTREHSQGDITRAAEWLAQLAVVVAHAEPKK